MDEVNRALRNFDLFMAKKIAKQYLCALYVFVCVFFICFVCLFLCFIDNIFRCKLVCENVVEINCSEGHLFCEECLLANLSENCELSPNSIIDKTNHRCPIDNELIKHIFPSKFIQKQISNLIVRCPRSNKKATKEEIGLGLNDTLTADVLTNVININNNNTNNNSINKKDSDGIMKIDTDLDEKLNINDDDMNCDWVGCLKHLKNHMLTECEERIVSCPFSEYGCNISKLKFKDIPFHIEEERVLHSNLLKRYSEHPKSEFLLITLNKSLNMDNNQIICIDSYTNKYNIVFGNEDFIGNNNIWDDNVNYSTWISCNNVSSNYINTLSNMDLNNNNNTYGHIVFRLGGCHATNKHLIERNECECIIIDNKSIVKLPHLQQKRCKYNISILIFNINIIYKCIYL